MTPKGFGNQSTKPDDNKKDMITIIQQKRTQE